LAAALPAGADNVVPEALVDYPVADLRVPEAADSLLLAGPGVGDVAAPGGTAPTVPDGAGRAIPVMEPIAQFGMWLPGPLAVVLALGDTAAVCAGVQAGTVMLGCAGDQPATGPAGSEIGVSTGGTVLPETNVTIPIPADPPLPTPPPTPGRALLR